MSNIINTVFKYSNILAVVGIIVTVIIFLLSDKKKELSLSTESFISLVDKNSLSGSGITVSFDSVPVTNLYKVNFTVTNTGNSAVVSTDFVDKIKIKFDKTATLLKYEKDAFPRTIDVNDQIVKNEIWLSPDLLNPNDRISFSAYYTLNKAGVLPTSDSRIIDGNLIVNNAPLTSKTKRIFLLGFSSTFENVLLWLILAWNIIMFFVMLWAVFLQPSQRANSIYVKTFVFLIVGGPALLTILYIIARDFI